MKTFVKLIGVAALVSVLFTACSNPFWPDKDNDIALTGTVTINNTSPAVGDTLIAEYSGNGTGTPTWVWLADGTAIEVANTHVYEVTAADLGKTITAQVSFADQSGHVSSEATSAVTPATKPALTGTVTIDNTSPAVGDTLTAEYSDGNGTGTPTWVWLADGTAIEVANTHVYEVTAADLGKTITVHVSYTDQSGHISSEATSAVTPATKPALTGTVTIDNTTPAVGDTLTAEYSDGNGTGTPTWQWLANGTAIEVANTHVYEVTAADLGKTITVHVSYTDQSGHVSSEATNAVTPATKPALTGTVTIDNTSPAVGNTLTASYSGNGTGTPTWVWLANGTAIEGANTHVYEVTAADLGKTITAHVSYSEQSGHISSEATNAVTPAIGSDTTAPVLLFGNVHRTNDTEATIGFQTDEAGTAYYLVQNSGDAAPTSAQVKAGTSLGAVTSGANSDKAVTLTAGAKDIYVVVVDSSGNISAPLHITAAAYNATVFEVYDVATLKKVGTGTDGWTLGASYIQIAHINMSAETRTPIGSSTTPFTGVYDGGGFVISNLSITSTASNTGLFGFIGTAGTVKNVNVSNGTVTSSGSNLVGFGGIAGENNGTMDNCAFQGTVNGGTSTNQVGGIVGQNNGTVRNSRSNATSITGGNQVGGFAGTNQGLIENCYNIGNITGVQQVGGIAGVNRRDSATSPGIIRNCYNTGSIASTSTGTRQNTGGIVGWNHMDGGTVEYCYNTGSVTGVSNVGGIAGNNQKIGSYDTSISNCVSLGLLVSGSNTNRIAGLNTGATLAGNKARADMKIGASGSEAVVSGGTATNVNGADVAVGGSTTQSSVFSGWSSAVWEINGNLTGGGTLPMLKTVAQTPPTLPSPPADTTAPTLSAGSVSRTSDTAATISFTTDEAGTAYYLVQNSGVTAPTNTAVRAGTSLGAATSGANTGKSITLTAGAKDIYVIVEDAAGNISTPLKIEAAAYGPASLIEMVKITGGTYQMGSPNEESGHSTNEDLHNVTLPNFYIGKYEVTQTQYQTVMGSNPSYYKTAVSGESETPGKLPVDSVSWYRALVFCNKLSVMEGLNPVYTIKGSTDTTTWGTPPTGSDTDWDNAIMDISKNGYRLPTEAEWEYACRAGTTTAYNNTGDTLTTDTGWHSGNSTDKTHQVGLKTPNAWGLYDMHGNVYEWCWDWYDIDFYESAAANNDPTGPSTNSYGDYRINRGGSYQQAGNRLRSAWKNYPAPSSDSDEYGFRVVRRY